MMTSALVALVLNIPFNFTGVIFKALVENVTIKKDKYLMYARFLQLVLNSQLPALPRREEEKIRLEHITDITLARLKAYRGMAEAERPAMKRLVGHLVNPEYVAPGGLQWRHSESDSDSEDLPMLPAETEKGAEQQQTFDEEMARAINISLEEVFGVDEEDLERDVEDTFFEIVGSKRQRTEDPSPEDPPASTASASAPTASASSPAKPSKPLHLTLATLDKRKRRFQQLTAAAAAKSTSTSTPSTTSAPPATTTAPPPAAPSSQAAPPIFTTSTGTPPIAQTSATTSGGVRSSSQVDESIATMSMMVLRVTNRNDLLTEKVEQLADLGTRQMEVIDRLQSENTAQRQQLETQQAEIDELKRQHQADLDLIAKLREEMLEQRMMLMTSTNRQDKLEERIHIIEESMTEEEVPAIEGATAAGTSAGTSQPESSSAQPEG